MGDCQAQSWKENFPDLPFQKFPAGKLVGLFQEFPEESLGQFREELLEISRQIFEGFAKHLMERISRETIRISDDNFEDDYDDCVPTISIRTTFGCRITLKENDLPNNRE